MKKHYSRMSILLMAILLFSANSFAQNNKGLWTKGANNELASEVLVFRKSQPKKGQYLQLDVAGLKQLLASAPNSRNTAASNLIIDFPFANGKMEAYSITETSIMHPNLQARYTNIRTYTGQSVKNPSKTMVFSVTPQGLHAMTVSGTDGTQFIDPYSNSTDTYILYSKRDLPSLESDFVCEFEDEMNVDLGRDFDLDAARNANDGKLRDFRLAIACTREYSSFQWQEAGLTGLNSAADRKAAVMAAMVVTMNRVNGIYKRDLSITMTFVANNDDLIFLNSDNFSNDDSDALINESQSVITSVIGSANYDIGHTFSTGGGGLASLNSPCNNTAKARGITGSPAPVGDAYDVDYVAHEMGHQFGAPHTFNGSEGNCAGGNRTASNAYEPGSGTTIMAYAGICAPQNVQGNSDAYFHQKSLQMIWDNVSGGVSQCGDQTTSGNSAPTADAGANYVIPASTPYMLVGNSTDAENTNTHTYTWEQYDLGTAGVPTTTTATGPLVRSIEGTNNPIRYIPNIPDLIQSGGSTDWEKLASVGRDINFNLTVRDNDTRGGQTAVDGMKVTTSAGSGPFVVLSQNADVTWSAGNTETITWDVAGTNSGAVNTPMVDILLSTDGGETFGTTLATAVPNNGSYDIIVPDVLKENCRVMVKGNGNVFFNINTARIAIGYNITAGETCTTYNFPYNETLVSNADAFSFTPGVITDSGIITDLNVKLDITTSDLGNLHMAVLSPGGTRGYLYPAGPCATGANMQVTWDQESTESITCGEDPTTGTVMPVATSTPEPLSAIYGEEMNGSWDFMTANLGGSTMVLNYVDLEICTTGYVANPAPNRVNNSAIQVEVSNTATVLESHLKVTSSNTNNNSDIQYTISEVPTKGTLYLNGSALDLNNTFTQADIAAGNVTYTTTASTDDNDSFRVNLDDNNGGTLPNLLVNIQILENLSVDDFGFGDSLIVYPNPSNGAFNVKLQSNSNNNVSVEVFDIRGRSVLSQSFNNNGDFNQSINLNDVQAGIYLLNINDGERQATKKIIIK